MSNSTQHLTRAGCVSAQTSRSWLNPICRPHSSKLSGAPRNARALEIHAATDSLRQYTVLYDIAGEQASDVYACGSNGVIVHWNGKNWTTLSSGTHHHLRSIHYLSDAEILICGHHGAVIRGSRQAGFKRITAANVSDNVWTIRSHPGSIYVGTAKGLMTVEDSGLKPVPLPADVPDQYAVAAPGYCRGHAVGGRR